MIDLVIFDCDGVLVDSEPVANRVFGALIRALGWSLDPAESSRLFIGHSMPECVRIVEERLGRPAPPSLLADYHQRLCRAYEAELAPVPGVVAVLERLRAPRCVASNGDRDKIIVALEQTGLLRYFGNRVFSGLDVPRPKPHPDVYLAAAAALGAAPERCVVIEDSVIGATAARHAGMRTLGFAPHGDGDGAALAAVGAEVFGRMDALFELLPPALFAPASNAADPAAAGAAASGGAAAASADAADCRSISADGIQL